MSKPNQKRLATQKNVAGIRQETYSEYQHPLINAEAEDSLDKQDNNLDKSNNFPPVSKTREEEINSDQQMGTGKFLPPAQTFLSEYRKNQLFGRKRNLSPSEEYLVKSESNLSDKLAKFAHSNINHPPIGQFTPQNSDRCESFTCKLRAMVQEGARE